LIILSFSQLAWIALILTTLILFFAIQSYKNNVKLFVIFCLLLSFVLAGFSSNLVDKFNYDQSINQRLELNFISQRLFFRRPMFGVGLGNFVNVTKTYPDKSLIFANKTVWSFQPVHNIFLLILSETGILGLIFFMMLLLKFVAKKNTDYILLLLPVLITGLGDHYWLTLQQNQILFAIVVGIIFSYTTKINGKANG
jgi:O-antigen ligase